MKKLTQYKQLNAAKPIKRWLVAYSGGIDSTVLLHAVVLCNQNSKNILPLLALHVNHQLTNHAYDWEEHCRRVVTELGVEYVHKTVDVIPRGHGIEAAAREARYQVFEDYLQEGDCLLFAHHRDDQAETVLLRLFRGAGVRGLMAMPESRTIGQAILLRPLLWVTKNNIISYAQKHKLSCINDHTNTDNRYDRNFLRNIILPSLEKRWSGIDRKLAKLSERMQETDELLNILARYDLQKLDLQVARIGHSIDYSKFSILSLARKNNLIRYWCESLSYTSPDVGQRRQLEKQFFKRGVLLNSACVSWGGVELRQFSGRIYLMLSLPKFEIKESILEWHSNIPICLGSAGQLTTKASSRYNWKGIRLKKKIYQIRWREGGERCRPSDRQHSQTVKKLLQEYFLETWLRDRVPLIYDGNYLVAVADLWVNQGYVVDDINNSVLIYWIYG